MKCTDNSRNSRKRQRMRQRKRRRMRRIFLCVFLVVVLLVMGCIGVSVYRDSKRNYTAEYEIVSYDQKLFEGDMFAQDLCVSEENDVALSGFADNTSLHAAGLFDIDNKNVLYGYHLYDRLFPASTTKVMVAYVALKYGNLDDIVTVSEHATDLEWDSSVCGLRTGDTLTLYDLLCGLLLQSGNDAGIAIAEHISGSEEEFVALMNEEMQKLGATQTHFVNPHGLQDDDHYTTAYDLYLMFNAAVQSEQYVEIIEKTSYAASVTGTDGVVRTEEWTPTNYYALGEAEAPEGVHVLGGKTGTTDEAGSCLILYSQDMDKHPFISIVMGADEKSILYDEMTALLARGIADQ